jgi:hypothetical protein
MVPVNAIVLIITHASEKHTTSLRLLNNVLNHFRAPVIVLTVFKRIFSDSQRPGRTKEGTAVTAYAILRVTHHHIVFSVIIVRIKCALVDAYLTLDTPLRVSLYQKSWW